MSETWPTADLDGVRRLRAVAAGVSGAAVTERVLPQELPAVWALLTDFEGAFTTIQPDMRRVRILAQDGERVRLAAASRFGMQAGLTGVVRPGFCWLQSRFLIVAMAAAPEPGGGTRVALTGGVRLPRRPAILPLGVRLGASRSLDRLAELVAEG